MRLVYVYHEAIGLAEFGESDDLSHKKINKIACRLAEAGFGVAVVEPQAKLLQWFWALGKNDVPMIAELRARGIVEVFSLPEATLRNSGCLREVIGGPVEMVATGTPL